EEIVVQPEPYDPTPLSSRVVHIRDPNQIAQIADLLRKSQTWHANHPEEKWAMILRFVVNGREFTGKLDSTSNQGVLFWRGLGPTPSVNYGTYRVDDLGPLIERIVRKSN